MQGKTRGGFVIVAVLALAFALVATPALAGADGDLVLGAYTFSPSCTEGTTNCTDTETAMTNNGAGAGLAVFAVGGDGLDATALSGDGVNAEGPTAGVVGSSSGGTGVIASGVTGVSGASSGDGDGVDGTANNSCCSAVYGLNNGTGNGVAGRADTGTGVLAASTSGTALRVTGKAKFSRSAIVTVPAGSNLLTVTLAKVTATSMVIATAQQQASVAVQGVVPASPSSGRFTIYLTGNAPTGGLKVAYFVLN